MGYEAGGIDQGMRTSLLKLLERHHNSRRASENAQTRSFSLYAHDPKTCRSSNHQIPVFPCPAGNFGKTQLGTDFAKAARSATMKLLPLHAFPAGPS